MMLRRSAASSSCASVFPSIPTWKLQGVTRRRLRRRTVDPPSSCGVLSDTIGSGHREVSA
jgi:hypothetical protein